MRTSSLNHTYKLVWSQVSNAWIAVSEIAKSNGKSKSQKIIAKVLALVTSALFATATWAGPEGGVVTDGSGTIHYNGATTTINQASQTLNLNWNTFNVASHETVNFVQPSATALAVNQILDTNGSRIMGNINANGQVWLINPNGIYFGAGAQINVGSLLASTLNPLTNANGTQVFGNGGTGSIINHGNINATHGYVAFVANTVSNAGNITANGGTVAMGAGSQVSLKFADNQLLSLTVDQSTLNNLAENKGLIQSNGGAVLLSAGARDSLLASVVNNEGVIEAKTVDHKAGKIILMGGMEAGTTKVKGTLDASAQTGNGGFIETSAAKVSVADSANITTKSESGDNGTWLIDPLDFTIAASGGNVTGAAIGTALANNSVKIATANTTATCTGVACTTGTTGNGDIHVNDNITWSSGNTLTLSAYRNININKSIRSQHANGKLALEYGQGAVASGNTATYNVNAKVNLQSGDNFSTKLGSDGGTTQYKVITSLGSAGDAITAPATMTLQGINASPSGNYVLGADIDASATSSWNSGAGFAPIGPTFTGRFDGLGHTISNLKINRPDTDNVGLFSYVKSGFVLQNIGIVNPNITGRNNVGGLAGWYQEFQPLNNSFVQGGSITGVDSVGGLVGRLVAASVTKSYAATQVNGRNYLGGLVGYAINSGFSISNSYADSVVVGQNSSQIVGGLVGFNSDGFLVDKSYSTSSVTVGTSSGAVGGLVGYNNAGTVQNSYATGKVTVGSGTGFVGGLVGQNSPLYGGTVTNSYWDTASTGVTSAWGGYGSVTNVNQVNATNRYTQSAYGYLNFSNDWYMVDGSTRPFLRSEYSTNITNTHQLQLMAMSLGASYTLANNINAAETAGTNASGMWGTAGFKPVGNNNAVANRFSGIFDGLGHTINNISINRYDDDLVGLFGYASGTIRNVGLVGGTVTGRDRVGALAGESSSTISNAYVTSAVNGRDYTGGLVGMHTSGAISNVYATGNVNSQGSTVGGLVGYNGGTISNAYATGRLNGAGAVGGLVGSGNPNNVSNSFWDIETSLRTTSPGGGIGKTTAEMKALSTFSGAGWSVMGSGGAYPVLNYSGTGTTWIIGSPVTSVNFKLDTLTGNYTYKGSAYELASLWSASNIFGNDYSSWVAGTDYTFSQGGSTVTGFTNAGTYSNITVNVLKSGFVAASSGNTAANFTITPKVLDLSGSRVYDGGTNIASGVLSITTGLVGTETLVLSGSGTVSSKNASATAQTLATANYSLANGNNGGLASNYTLVGGTKTVTITPKVVTLTAGAVSKTYDGGLTYTTQAADLNALTNQLISGDTVTAATIVYADKNAGTNNKTVTLDSVTINDSNNGGNYTVTKAGNATSTINKKDLTVTAGQVTKTYDGTLNATGTGTVGTLATNDSVNSAGSQAFTDKNFGIGNKTVVASGVTIKDTTNADMTGNYNIIYQNNTNSTINKKDLTVTAGQVTKTYDGTTTATGTGTVGTLATNDSVNSAGSQAFTDKNFGIANKTVVASGVTIKDNTNADMTGNYNIIYQNNTNSTINKKDLTVTAGQVTKTYDGTTTATGTGTVGTLATNDSVNGAGSQAFTDKNFGIANKTVVASGVTIKDNTNADMTGNYNIIYQNNTTSTINKASLVYVGLPVITSQGQPPTLTGNVNGFVSGEGLGNLTGTLAWSTNADLLNPGVYGMTGSGLSSQNYTFSQAVGNATAVTVVAASPSQPVNNVTSNIQQPVQNPVNNPNSTPPTQLQVVTINNNQVNPAAGNAGGSDADTPVTNQSGTLPLGNTVITGTITIIDGGVNIGNTFNNNQDN